MSPARRRGLVTFALAATAVLAFAGLLDPGRVFFQRDVGTWTYPQLATFRALVGSGAWPLWDPYEGFGTPMLADPQSQVLYPPQWLALVLPGHVHYKLMAFLHLALAGAGAYRWMRRLGTSGAGALAGAFVWQCSGPLLSFATMTQHFAGAAWMPWVLLMLERLLRRRDAASTVALGATAAAQALAGSPDMCLLTGLLAAARLALEGRAAPAHAGRCAGAAALAGGLAAVQWLPAAAVVAGSARAQMVGLNTYWSLHPAHLVDVLALRLLTDAPIVPAVRAIVFEGREPLVETLYLGPMAVGLAVAGAFSRRGTGAAGALVGFGLLAIGKFGPLEALFALPPFSLFRYPMKYTVPAALIAAVLVAFGVDRWRAAEVGRRPFAAAGAVLLALACAGTVAGAWAAANPARLLPLLEGPLPAGATRESALLWPMVGRLSLSCGLALFAALLLLARARGGRTRVLLALAGVALVVPGLVGARTANRLGPRPILDPPPAAALVHGDRVWSVRPPQDRLNRDLRSQPGWTREELVARAQRECLGPATAALEGRRGSFDGDPTLLAPPVFGQASALLHRYRHTPFGVRLLQLAAVTDVVVCADHEEWPLPPIGTAPGVLPEPVRVFAVPGTLERIRLVPAVVETASVDETWHHVGSPSFDPSTQVVLETGRSVPATAGAGAPSLRVIQERADRLDVAVRAEQPVVLVVTDAWSPGWRAWIDGRPAAVLRANQLFRGVRVPAGAHSVTVAYRPPEVAVGLAVSGVSVLVLLGVLRHGRAPRALPPDARPL